MERSLGKVCSGGNVRTLDRAKGLMSSMKQIEDEIDGLTEHTGREFLSIGERLYDFHGRAMRISEVSAGVAAGITGLEIVSSIDNLNGLMEKMENYLDCSAAKTEARIEQLREILGL